MDTNRSIAGRALWLAVVCAAAAAGGCGGAEPVDSTDPEELPQATAGRYQEYPEKIASFGAAVLDDHLYVYSGHVGETHSHSIDNLSKAFRRLDLAAEGAAWETLSFRDPVQSTSLVPHGGSLYRIGGMTAQNGMDDIEEKLSSTATFERYRPGADSWEQLPALPAARSSHDAVVVGDTLYVFGGWELSGGDSASGAFHDTGLKLDLAAANPTWEEVDQPFKRRAVCVAAVGETIVAIGGLTEEARGSLRVDVYDAATGKWSVGPDAPATEDTWNAFGCTAFGVDGGVVFSGRDGVLSRLEPGGWVSVGTMTTSRFFHRMVPNGTAELLLVGGATLEGDHLADIEVFPL